MQIEDIHGNVKDSLDDMFHVQVSWQCKVCYKWVKAQYNELEASPQVIA
jgi:hypothetical protein